MLENVFERNMTDRRPSNLSNLEKNIFITAPAITREILERLNHDMVPQKTAFFGHQMNTRRFIVLTGLILLFTFSTMGTITMWFTNAYSKKVESMAILSDDSYTFEMWRKTPVRPQMKITFFNYTNVEEFENGSVQKLTLEEVGPYVYWEQMERINIRFNKFDGTVSYQEKRNYEFSKDLSKGTQNDTIIVPNIPLLSGASRVKDMNYFVRLGFQTLLNALNQQTFTAQNAHDLITGYDDKLYEMSKSYLAFNDLRVFEHFGFLTWKQGIQKDIITQNTGAYDINKLGQIESFNGQTHVDMWRTDKCNSLQSSDGATYPMNRVRRKEDVDFVIPQLCRKLTLKFVKKTRMLNNKIPVYRYKLPENAIDTVDNPENSCYCEKSTNICPPKGIFNATLCSMLAPVFYSWPHFQGADPSLLEKFSGLNPSPKMSDNYLDLHPKFGTVLRGKISMQVNIQLEKSYGLSALKSYPDGLLLPTAILQYELSDDDLTEDVVTLIHLLSFTVRNLELGLKYGFLLCTMVTFACILLMFRHQRAKQQNTV